MYKEIGQIMDFLKDKAESPLIFPNFQQKYISKVSSLEDMDEDSMAYIGSVVDDPIKALGDRECCILLVDKKHRDKLEEIKQHAKIIFICDDAHRVMMQTVNFFFDYINVYNLHNSVKTESAVIGEDSYIGPNVIIGKNVIIGFRTYILGECFLENVEIGNDCIIYPFCSIGLDGFSFIKEDNKLKRCYGQGKVVIGNSVEIRSHTNIDKGLVGDTYIGNGVKIDSHCHIGHNCFIDDDSLIITNVTFGGWSRVGKRCRISMGTIIRNRVVIGDEVFVGMGMMVYKDIPSGTIMNGSPKKI